MKAAIGTCLDQQIPVWRNTNQESWTMRIQRNARKKEGSQMMHLQSSSLLPQIRGRIILTICDRRQDDASAN